jgi:hypothetical protein
MEMCESFHAKDAGRPEKERWVEIGLKLIIRHTKVDLTMYIYAYMHMRARTRTHTLIETQQYERDLTVFFVQTLTLIPKKLTSRTHIKIDTTRFWGVI